MRSNTRRTLLLMACLTLTLATGCSKEGSNLRESFTLSTAEPRISLELRNLIARPSGSGITIQEVVSKKAVQFSLPAGEPLLVLLPAESLSPEESARALRIFADLNARADAEGGVRVYLEREAFGAAAVAMRALREVYLFDDNAELNVITD